MRRARTIASTWNRTFSTLHDQAGRLSIKIPTNQPVKIAVIGIGAIGTLLSGALAKASRVASFAHLHLTVVTHRPTQAETIRRQQGLRIERNSPPGQLSNGKLELSQRIQSSRVTEV